jgi:hypothetical protein
MATRLSHERCVHLSHQFANLLDDDDRVDFLADVNDIRLTILKILEGEIVREEQMEESIRRRIATQRRDLPEGSTEWDLLFRKYYDDEMKKVRRVRQ